MCALCIKPKLANKTSIADPPYDINGKGTPTTGARPTTIAMFTAKYRKKFIVNPAVNSEPNLFLFVIAEIIEKRIINAYMTKILIAPKKPNSSANVVNMKSV